jgi:crossover junction endodeoxyribonuclease RusA
MKITFPFPPKELLPNQRGHWAKHARVFKAYKESCMWMCKAAKIKTLPLGDIHLEITFVPPDYRPRDLDNMLASFKACQDAIAASIGIDDRFFTTTHRKAGKCLGGAVEVTISHSIKVAA